MLLCGRVDQTALDDQKEAIHCQMETIRALSDKAEDLEDVNLELRQELSFLNAEVSCLSNSQNRASHNF